MQLYNPCIIMSVTLEYCSRSSIFLSFSLTMFSSLLTFSIKFKSFSCCVAALVISPDMKFSDFFISSSSSSNPGFLLGGILQSYKEFNSSNITMPHQFLSSNINNNSSSKSSTVPHLLICISSSSWG
ncbi:hypothetical protein GOODEAATRI_033748 [Goodea atripinnis]|uniref:Uncharacterized protein n=1 Tax=Goodea atripinnis TaxID=208336 RepID=A0ABV0MXA7_9TELE